MENNNLILHQEIFGSLKTSWTTGEFKSAIEKFRKNAPGIPLPRLFDAYCWVKQQIDPSDEVLDKQFLVFNELFLRTLEERGESGTEIYTKVLRDSSEYKYMKELFHRDDTEQEKPEPEVIPEKITPEKKIKIITLKDILSEKNKSLIEFDIESWRKLVDEHFKGIKNEEPFVKDCSGIIARINRISEQEQYHLEIIIIIAYEKLLLFKKLSVKSKDFAMRLLNLSTGNKTLWRTLNKEYLEIIRK